MATPRTDTEKKSESTEQGLHLLGAGPEEETDDDRSMADVATADYRDIDPEEWLAPAADGPIVGYFTIDRLRARIKIAALTEDETDAVMRASRKPEKGTNRKVMDAEQSKLMCIAVSINKANGKLGPQMQFLQGAVLPANLKQALAGEVTECYKAVSELSGFKRSQEDIEKARDFFD